MIFITKVSSKIYPQEKLRNLEKTVSYLLIIALVLEALIVLIATLSTILVVLIIALITLVSLKFLVNFRKL